LLARPDLWLVSMRAAGLYISRDEGATWTRVKSGSAVRTSLGTTAISAARASDGPFPVLLAVGAAGRIYAGSSSDGLYVLDFSGTPAPKSLATDAVSVPGGH
jgi:hypothetical protein